MGSGMIAKVTVSDTPLMVCKRVITSPGVAHEKSALKVPERLNVSVVVVPVGSKNVLLSSRRFIRNAASLAVENSNFVGNPLSPPVTVVVLP